MKQKLERPAPACQLYTSLLFRRQREWATSRCGRWFILSAKYGLAKPEQIIQPYEMTLKTFTPEEKCRWSARVLENLKRELTSLDSKFFEIYAGGDYVNFGLIDGLKKAGAVVSLPWSGLGLGKRLARSEYAANA